MEDLFKLIENSFDDEVFTRRERKELRAVVKEAQLDTHKLGVLRSKIFDFAREACSRTDPQRVLDWLEEANKLLSIPKQGSKTHEVFFSPGDECYSAIREQLQHAKRSVDICVFTITDNRISNEIIDCFQRGIRVRIISDNEKLHDPGSDILEMEEENLDIRIDRSPHHMHHKFAIFDKQSLLTGSYNWTRSAAKYNEENILITTDPEIVIPFQKRFDDLWRKMKDL